MQLRVLYLREARVYRNHVAGAVKKLEQNETIFKRRQDFAQQNFSTNEVGFSPVNFSLLSACHRLLLSYKIMCVNKFVRDSVSPKKR